MKKKTLPLSVLELLKTAKMKEIEFNLLWSDRDKMINSIRVFMEENEDVFKKIADSNPEKYRKLMEKDPLFRKLFEMSGEAYSYFIKSVDEKKQRIDAYSQNLQFVIFASASLSEHIDLLTAACARVINSPKLISKFMTEKPWETSTTRRLQFLRFADIIDEEVYSDLYIIYKIRNKFAHISLLHLDEQKILSSMNNLKLEEDKIKSMPNNIFVTIQTFS